MPTYILLLKGHTCEQSRPVSGYEDCTHWAFAAPDKSAALERAHQKLSNFEPGVVVSAALCELTGRQDDIDTVAFYAERQRAVDAAAERQARAERYQQFEALKAEFESGGASSNAEVRQIEELLALGAKFYTLPNGDQWCDVRVDAATTESWKNVLGRGFVRYRGRADE